VERDFAKAIELYREAANQGNAETQSRRNGQGVKSDFAKAVEFYRKAANQGNANAQNNLGWCYRNGRGVEMDLVMAIGLYRKSPTRALRMHRTVSVGVTRTGGD
jgi:TPR repeat protein